MFMAIRSWSKLVMGQNGLCYDNANRHAMLELFMPAKFQKLPNFSMMLTSLKDSHDLTIVF